MTIYLFIIMGILMGFAIVAIAVSLMSLWDDSEEDDEMYFFPIDEDGRA
jgi:hypothetical protein